jgi:uncharacterized membrane protein
MSYKRTRKKKIALTAFLATSIYSSILFTAGITVGYLATRFFYKRYIENGPLKLIFIDIRGQKFHLHHWIIGILMVTFFLMAGWKSELPKFLWGIIFGMILQDIYDFEDWHKVLAKEKAA